MNQFEYFKITPSVHLLVLHGDRETLNVEVTYTTGGSWYEKTQDRGKKHLLEHCIVARTKDMDHATFKNWERKNNISINAYTSPSKMALIAKGHKSDCNLMVKTLLECTFDPTFDQSDLDREKEIVLREISERRGDPNYQLYYDTARAIFVEGDYQTHETLGDPEMVAQTTLEDFVKLNTQSLSDGHIVITVNGGGIDTENIINLIKAHCGSKDESTNKKTINYRPDTQMKDFRNKAIIHEHAHQHADVTLYIPFPVSLDNLPARTVFTNLYLQYGGVIYDRLRDEKRLVYGISSAFDIETETLQLYLTCESEYIEQIVHEIEEIFEDFNRYFDPQKLADYTSVVYKKQAISNDDLHKSLAFTKSLLLTYNKLVTSQEFIEKLKTITESDIKDVFTSLQKGWKHRKLLVISKNDTIKRFDSDEIL